MHTNWDDLRFILSVAKHGSVAAGARALGVNHSTVLRRISAYEESRDVRVFVRHASGYQLTEAGHELVRVLQAVDGQFEALERKLAGHDLRVEGRVTITTTDSIAIAVMSPYITALMETFPLMRPEFTVTNGHLDFGRRDADVTVRPCIEPPPDLVGERACAMPFRLYAGGNYLERNGDKAIAEHTWLGLREPLSQAPPSFWMEANVPDARVAMRADSFVSLAGATAAGAGIALLPVCVEHIQSGLVPLDHDPIDLGINLWVLTHRDLQRAATIRACADFLVQRLRTDAAVFEG